MAEFEGHYINQKMVENRLSSAVVRRIYDDDNVGFVGSTAHNDGPIVQLIKDSESMFEGYCKANYSLSSLRTAKPPESVRLCLDCAEALAAKRFPRAFGREWLPLLTAVRQELVDLRTGKTRLDVDAAPEPAANAGGDLYIQDAGLEDTQPYTFTRNGFGGF